MRIDPESLCMGCMREKGEEKVCPFCGYSEENDSVSGYLKPRSIIGRRYLVGRLLSANGEGTTYLGYDTVADRRVRIREYFPDTLVSRGEDQKTVLVRDGCQILFKAGVSDFIDLMQKLFSLKGAEGLETIFALEEENNTVYAVMEYTESVTLRQFIEKKGLMMSWDEATEIMTPVIKAVEVLHRVGIIHRGISTDTILLGRNRMVRLDGFGLSDVRSVQSQLRPELFSGYSAPEQYSTVTPHGTWTDVYGICAVFYTCLTGKVLPEGVLRKEGDIPSLRDRNETIPRSAERAILAGLEPDIEKRIRTIPKLIAGFGAAERESAGEAPTRYVPITPSANSRNITPPASLRQSEKALRDEEEEEEPGGVLSFFRQNRSSFLLVGGTIVGALLLMLLVLAMFLGGKEKEPSSSDLSSESGLTSDEFLSSEDSSSNPFSSPRPSFSSSSSSEESSENSSSSEESQELEMDNLVGKVFLEVAEDPQMLEKYSFPEPKYVFSDKYAEGIIISQSVVAGNSVAKGSEIELRVSKGPQYVTIPDYVGLSESQYLEQLDALKIAYKVEYRVDESQPEDAVLGTDHLVGSRYDLDNPTIISVYVNAYDGGLSSSESPSEGPVSGPGGGPHVDIIDP